MAAGNSWCFTAPSCRLSPAESPSIKPRGQLLTPPLADNSPCPLGDDKTTPLSPPPLAVVSLGVKFGSPATSQCGGRGSRGENSREIADVTACCSALFDGVDRRPLRAHSRPGGPH